MRVSRQLILVVLSSSALACATLRGGPRTPPSPTVATVNGDRITARELRAEFGQSHQGHSNFLVAGENEAAVFLQKLVDKRLLLQEGKRMGLPARSDIRESVAQVEAQEMAKYLVKKEIEDPSKATDAEIQDAFENRITTLYEVREFRAETKEDAEKALAQVKGGEDFDHVARDASTASTRSFGGLVLNFGWGSRSAEIEAVAFTLADGQVSDVVRTPQGWEFVKVESRRAANKVELPTVRARIVTLLEKRKRTALDTKLRETLWAKYHAALGEPASAATLAKVEEAITAEKRDPAADTVLATWDGGKLTLGSLVEQIKAKDLSELPEPRYRRVYEELVTQTVYGQLVQKEAVARGYGKVPEVAEAVALHAENVIVDVLLAEYVSKNLKPTEEGAKKWFDENPDRFAIPEARNVAHIEVETLEDAKAVQALLASGKSFEELVPTHSKNEASKKGGGSLGPVTRAECPPGFEPVFDLEAGQVSEPIAGKGGYHLVKVSAITPKQPREWEQVKAEVLAAFKKKQHFDALFAWTKRLREVATIKVDVPALKQFVKDSEAEAAAMDKAPGLPSSHGMGAMMGGGHGGGEHGGMGGSPHGGGMPGGSPHGGGMPLGGAPSPDAAAAPEAPAVAPAPAATPAAPK
jgi:peptidyl-prolyl cis-trans isomerase C